MIFTTYLLLFWVERMSKWVYRTDYMVYGICDMDLFVIAPDESETAVTILIYLTNLGF